MGSGMLVWQLVLIQLITFAALVFGLQRLFSRNLKVALKRLQALQEEAMVKEAELKEELERAREEREAEIEKGRQEANMLVAAARDEAERMRTNAEEQAKQETLKILGHGKAELEKQRAIMQTDLDSHALDMALQLIRYTFEQQSRQDFQHQLLKELIEEITKLDASHFSLQTGLARVVSSFPLSEQERQQLHRTLGDKVRAEIKLEEHLDQSLIAGLVVYLGPLVIDGSLKNSLQKAVYVIKEQRRQSQREAVIAQDPIAPAAAQPAAGGAA